MPRHNLFHVLTAMEKDRSMTIKEILFAGIKKDTYRFVFKVKINKATFKGSYVLGSGNNLPTAKSKTIITNLRVDGITLTEEEEIALTDTLFAVITGRGNIGARKGFLNAHTVELVEAR